MHAAPAQTEARSWEAERVRGREKGGCEGWEEVFSFLC